MTSGDGKDLMLFEQQTIRRVWHNNDWYYSIVDVIAVLTESANPRNYWNMLKTRTKSEGFDEAVATIVPLKLKSADNRFRLTETANRATLLRLIQSIPSPRAEPFRMWLAQVGDERLEEIEHPESAIERVRELYRSRGHDEAWIEARIRNDLARNELTDEWRDRGAKEGMEGQVGRGKTVQDIWLVPHMRDLIAGFPHNCRDCIDRSANLFFLGIESALTACRDAQFLRLHTSRWN